MRFVDTLKFNTAVICYVVTMEIGVWQQRKGVIYGKYFGHTQICVELNNFHDIFLCITDTCKNKASIYTVFRGSPVARPFAVRHQTPVCRVRVTLTLNLFVFETGKWHIYLKFSVRENWFQTVTSLSYIAALQHCTGYRTSSIREARRPGYRKTHRRKGM